MSPNDDNSNCKEKPTTRITVKYGNIYIYIYKTMKNPTNATPTIVTLPQTNKCNNNKKGGIK